MSTFPNYLLFTFIRINLSTNLELKGLFHWPNHIFGNFFSLASFTFYRAATAAADDDDDDGISLKF